MTGLGWMTATPIATKRSALQVRSPHYRQAGWWVGSAIAALGWAIAPSPAHADSALLGSSPGTPVTPDTVDVYLEPDDAVTFTVEVETGLPEALDLFLLSDLTGSFYDDLPNMRNSVPSLVDGLSGIAEDVQFGLGTFADKPIYPFGGWYYNSGWYTAPDYVYRTELALTNDGAALQTAVNGLRTVAGLDEPEAQLEALFQVALRSQELGFRENAFKAVVIQTDARFHYADDPYRTTTDGTPYPLVANTGETRESLTPNNGDAVIDLWEDYPAITQVRDALVRSGIVPIFAVTENVVGTYQALVDQWGFGNVVTLNSDSSNLVQTVTSGIDRALNDVKLVVESDDFDYVRQIASDVSGEKEGIDEDVPAGDRARFEVTLEDRSSDDLTGDDTIYLTAAGYGRTTVNVTVPRPSEDPAEDPVEDADDPLVVDLDAVETVPEAVPEPGMVLGLMALIGAWGWRRSPH